MSTKVDPKELKRLYREKRNILEHMRERRGIDTNDEVAVLLAYDMQAGSYIRRTTTEPDIGLQNEASTTELARLFDDLGVASLLDAGTGEATYLCPILGKMKRPPAHVHAFDISFSRLLYGRMWTRRHDLAGVRFFVGSLLQVPVLGGAFDAVVTNHAIELNRGREREIIEELYRVCRRYLILREPSWELGNERTRARIEKHRYANGIFKAVESLGYEVIEQRLFESDVNPDNQSALTVIRKRERDVGDGAASFPNPPYASPLGKSPLVFTGEAYYSVDDALIFPVICGIPCLLAENGIFSTRYLEMREQAEDRALHPGS
jgi:SAM-dependent methyltransferase